MPLPVTPALGPKEPGAPDTEAIADALEIALGARPSDEQVEAFCLACALAMEKHQAGEY